MEIELVGRVGGRTFDERKLEFEVGEGLNVNIPRSNDYMQIHIFSDRGTLHSLFFMLTTGELNLHWRK